MALFKIAYVGFKKYRKRRKNLTVILVGCFFLIFFFLSLFATIDRNLYNYWNKDFIGGHIILHKDVSAYDIFQPIPSEYFFSYNQFVKDNKRLEKDVAPHLRIGALLEKDYSQGCIVTGVDIHKETDIGEHLRLVSGRLFDENSLEIVMTETVASNIGAQLGDQVVLMVVTGDGYLNVELVEIVGLLDSSAVSQLFGSDIAYMSVSQLRGLLMVGDDVVSELLFRSDAYSWLDNYRIVGDFRVVKGTSFFSIARSLSFAFLFLKVVLFLLIFALSVSAIYHNVLLMSIERVDEIGIYLTYGARPVWVRRIMFLELFLYTFFCALIGIVVSFLLISGINMLGIYPSDIATKILISSSRFFINIRLSVMFFSFLILLGLVFLGGAKPIVKMTGALQIVDLFSKKNKG